MNRAGARRRRVGIAYILCEAGWEDTLQPLAAMLMPAEQAEMRLRRRPEDQWLFASGRLLVRRMLSGVATTPPGGWVFERMPGGKPQLPTRLGSPWQFNIAHATGIVAATVTTEKAVGIDVEDTRLAIDVMAIAQAAFSALEFNRLQQEPEKRRQALFFLLWTAKEALAKAEGAGIAPGLMPQLDQHLAPLLAASVGRGLDAGTWSLWRSEPTDNHRLAAAAHKAMQEDVLWQEEKVFLQDLLNGT